ncbi:hypothetical protein LNQ52_20260 [Klebsiella pneumoniae subsp. pneumoniae]|nr:hypothetical protein [Klebsiella pneumoniae subsp. pneumoniae]
MVDWYDFFLLYGITAALVFNREFFPQIGHGDGNACRLCHLRRWVSFFARSAELFLATSAIASRRETDADDDRLDDGYRHCLPSACSPSFSQIGWWAPVLLVFLRAVQGFAVGGEWGGAALLSVEECPTGEKSLLQQRGAGGLRRRPPALYRAGIAD